MLLKETASAYSIIGGPLFSAMFRVGKLMKEHEVSLVAGEIKVAGTPSSSFLNDFSAAVLRDGHSSMCLEQGTLLQGQTYGTG